jgi:undecaprenyl-diphosphatase
LRRIEDADLALCLHCNRLSHYGFWRALFRGVSRLGNGVFWYTLMTALLLAQGAVALPVVARMLLAAGLGLMVYKWLKAKTSRPRPYQVYQVISAAAPVLDRFSFPSGHTLHAVSFSLVACQTYPELAFLAWPFTCLVALSRPVLGLHYPSDVLAGAALGALIAQLVLLI